MIVLLSFRFVLTKGEIAGLTLFLNPEMEGNVWEIQNSIKIIFTRMTAQFVKQCSQRACDVKLLAPTEERVDEVTPHYCSLIAAYRLR